MNEQSTNAETGQNETGRDEAGQSKTDNAAANDNAANGNAANGKVKRGCLRFVPALLLGLVLAAGVLFLLARYLKPELDDSLVDTVRISNVDPSADQSSNASSDDRQLDADGAASSPLHESSITAGITQEVIDQAEHPLDVMLKVADDGAKYLDQQIEDYSFVLVKQTRIDGKLPEPSHILMKIRHEKEVDGETKPFGVYSKFLAPKSKLGQEGIWVKGVNDGKLIGHPPLGIQNVVRLKLDPLGSLAMAGQLRPITQSGMRNLYSVVIETAERERKHGECELNVRRGVNLNDRICTVFEMRHPERREHFDFHIARLYIDDELNVPIAFEGYDWPGEQGADPPILETYYFTKLELNIGLTDDVFDPDNPEYKYPKAIW